MNDEKYRVCLISGTYKSNNDGPVVELYGRTDTGKSILIKCSNFIPYFYVDYVLGKDFFDNLKHDKIRYVDPEYIELGIEDKTRKYARINAKEPYDVPELRNFFINEIKNRGYSVDKYTILAADIPFYHRFMYDLDLSLFVEVKGKLLEDKSHNVDIVIGLDVPSRIDKIETLDNLNIKTCEPFPVDLTYLSFDIENSIKTGHIYVIGLTIWSKKSGFKKDSIAIKDVDFNDGKQLDNAEKELLNDFVRKIKEIDPDIITGYNIGGYDIPYLQQRCEKHSIPLLIGRDNSALRSIKNSERMWSVYGRVFIDAWWEAKIEYRPKQETLDYVAKNYLGEGFKKMDVARLEIDKEWLKDKAKVIEYCINDSYLALEILKKIRVVEKGIDMGIVSKLVLDDAINGRTSLFIDSILIREADRNHVGVPLNTYNVQDSEQIIGGYVHDMVPGLFKWIVVLDFKSMYPSIIISKNICFTTLSANGEIESPNGIRFLSKDKKVGLIPKILTQLMTERDFHKRIVSELDDKIKVETDPVKIEALREDKVYHDGLQGAIKILMNSFYGVFASSFYRFTDKKIGNSITAFARVQIKSVIEHIQSDGYEVIYSDTDSVFINTGKNNLNDALEVGKKFSSTFSKEGVHLDLQYVIESFFSHGKKKRYVGRVVWKDGKRIRDKNGKESYELIVRGYEMRRSDSFDYQSYALQEIFNVILNGETNRIVEKARQLVNDVRAGKVPVEKLIISKAVREDLDSYKEKEMPSLIVYNKLKDMGHVVIPGMKVSWIVIDASKTPQKVEPYIDNVPFAYKPDYEYYAKRVAQTIARATEYFKCTEEIILRGTNQYTFDLANDKKDKEESPSKTPEKVRKTNNLYDYF
ncbi:MAG: DNA-directed DNA polymerase [Thermoplasmata archaeon]